MPLTLSLDDLLVLTINDPYTDARRWLYQYTSAGGWCAVVPEHVATQVTNEDPEEINVLIRKYESPIGSIHALFTRFNFIESGESRRLALARHAVDMEERNHTREQREQLSLQREKCMTIIDYFVRVAGVNNKGVVSVFRPVLQRAAVDSAWNCVKLVEILNLLGSSISLDLIPAHIREEYSAQTILEKYINESSGNQQRETHPGAEETSPIAQDSSSQTGQEN